MPETSEEKWEAIAKDFWNISRTVLGPWMEGMLTFRHLPTVAQSILIKRKLSPLSYLR